MNRHAALRSTPVRLALTLVAALAAGVAALALLIGFDVNRTLAERTERAVLADAARLAALAARDGIRAVEVAVRARGVEGAHYRVERDGQMMVSTFDAAVLPPQTGGVFSYQPAGRRGAGRETAFGVTIALDPHVKVTVARDISEQKAVAQRLQRSLAIGLAALALGGIAGGVALGRALDRRLARINTATRAIMAGDLSRRIERDDSGDEFDRLGGQLNEMLMRIEDLMLALRDVSDNIAHDLKTPINRLRNTAEEALRSTGGDRQRHALGSVIEQADAIIRTFNALLLIARLEHDRAAESPLEVVEIHDLVADVVDLYSPVAEDAKLALRVRVADHARHPVHRQLLTQAIANLVDNAIKYAGDPARAGMESLEVDVIAGETTLSIAVADRGPGIAAQDRESALKRFGRLDKSRSKPGTGLGLSLVAAIARLHGGQLVLGDNSPGLRAVIQLPRAKRAEA